MNETFDSVLLFYGALKTFLMTSVGLTVERTLDAHDVILTNGAGVYLRLQKKTNGSVVSVGLELGADPDVLEHSNKDPDLSLPFDAESGGIFQGVAHWIPDVFRVEVLVMASGFRGAKRYRVELTLNPLDLSILHQDHLNQATEPNFKERGGTYVQAGV